MRKIISFILVLGFLLLNPLATYAEISKGTSLSSDNFRILDSQQSIFGGTASISSSSFILTAVLGGLAIGSSSFTNFALRSGFLYYPKVTAAVLNTATAGDAQVALAWTAATAYQGWSIGGYNLCHKSTGSYTCVDVGNVTSSTKTGLTNGTSYTFKIQAYDGLAGKNVIAESNEKTATPESAATPTPTPTPSGGGGGGGGGGSAYVPSLANYGTIVIKGTAYPQSTVTVLNNSVVVATVKAGSSASFEVRLENVPAGKRTIAIYSQDTNGRKSVTINFEVTVTSGAIVTLSDVLLPPTIELSSLQISKGEILGVFGQSAPVAEVNVHIASEETVTKVISDNNGAYRIRFDTKILKDEEHLAKSRQIFKEAVSPFSRVLQFFVGKE